MKKILIYFFTAILLISCSNDDKQSNTDVSTGIIHGKVMTTNGAKPVGGALIFTFDDDNKIYYTHSLATGDFEFSIPVGQRNVYIQTGDGSNFRSQFEITAVKNQTVEVNATQTRLDQTATMAYVSGSYDSIEDIITELGYDADAITFSDLNDYSLISQYDVIYLNCGSISGSIVSSTLVTNNLAKFVTNGGSIYASDWAVAYLIGGTVNSSTCNEAGGFIPDATLCSIDNGSSGIINGTITNSDLSNATGLTALDINYDLGAWQQITNVDETYWDVLVKNTSTNAALMIKTNNFFDQNLLDSPVGSANNNDWITICHQTDNGSITITINANAWIAHEAHGDTLGSCTNDNLNGTIYYTTFHNHANGNIGNSQLILEHIILNL
jgi:hypothetical protein